MTVKYLVRNADNIVEDVVDVTPWATPDWWSGVGSTHREEDPPAGDTRLTIEDKGARLYMLSGSPAIWGDRDPGTISSEQLTWSQARRLDELCALDAKEAALSSLAVHPDPTLATDAAASLASVQARIQSLKDNYGSIWVPGVNP